MVRFQVLDVRFARGAAGDAGDRVQLFGVDAAGRDVCAVLAGYETEFHLRGDGPPVRVEVATAAITDLMRRLPGKPRPRSVQAVRLRPLLNFQGGRDATYYRVRVSKAAHVAAVRNAIRRDGVPYELRELARKAVNVHGTALDQVLRHFHASGTLPSGWVELEDAAPVEAGDEARVSRCEVELRGAWRRLRACPEEEGIAPFTLLSYDIETYSADGSFPQPHRPGDVVTQIGSTWTKWGSGEVFQRVDVLDLKGVGCDRVDGAGGRPVEIKCWRSEKNLLLGWRQWVISTCRPSVKVAYNNWGFDDQYLWKRAAFLGEGEQFADISKLVGHECKLLEKNSGSKQRGDRQLFYAELPGVVDIDLMQVLQADYKLESYSLKNVALHFLSGAEEDMKDDLSAPEMFRLFAAGEASGLATIAKYCAKDTLLPLRLLEKLEKVGQYVEMSRICLVPLRYLFTKGQQVKVRLPVSFVFIACRRRRGRRRSPPRPCSSTRWGRRGGRGRRGGAWVARQRRRRRRIHARGRTTVRGRAGFDCSRPSLWRARAG